MNQSDLSTNIRNPWIIHHCSSQIVSVGIEAEQNCDDRRVKSEQKKIKTETDERERLSKGVAPTLRERERDSNMKKNKKRRRNLPLGCSFLRYYFSGTNNFFILLVRP